MRTSSRGRQGLASGIFFGCLLLTFPFGRAEAQARVGAARASLTIPVQMVIRPRARISASEAPQVVARTSDQVEMEFAFVVASNVEWAVTVALPDDERQPGASAVRTETGDWATLTTGSEVRITGRMAPSNGTALRVRVRFPASASAALKDGLRFSVGAADGLAGR